VRCESEGANGPQFWIEQFCGGHTLPPSLFLSLQIDAF
jgi:hypothetical protein